MDATALVMPRNMFPSKSSFEDLGFSFDSSSNGAYAVNLPNGWSTLSSSHNSSVILDDKNRKRGFSFFGFCSVAKKDRVELLTRYNVASKRLAHNDRYSPLLVYIADSDGKNIHDIGLCGTDNSEDYFQLVHKAENYLDESFPDWRNPNKYWD